MHPLARVAAGVALALALTGAATSPARLTSLRQLVDDRRAVESVFWEHRIWPSTNPGPKPDFSQAFPDALLQSRVRDDLIKSAALGTLWNRPISGSDLQAEIDRMAAHTHDPDLLREIFAALNNDPERIAYALALPALVDRRLRSWYSQDDRFHGSLRTLAEQTLSAGRKTGPTAGEPVNEEVEYVLSGVTEGIPATPEAQNHLSSDEWKQFVGRLADAFGVASAGENLSSEELLARLPLHRASGLREEPDRFVSMTLLERSSDQIKVELTTWPKRPFESWWEETKVKLNPESGIPGPYPYTLQQAASQACENDTWQGIHTAVPYPRSGNSIIWTGTEVIVWGGLSPIGYLNTGHRYSPATDTWTSTGIDGSTPAPRNNHTAVWTGSEMIVWGGTGQVGATLGSGGRYNPLTDSWSAVKTDATSPTPRWLHSAVWTGSRMIVWGGSISGGHSASTFLNTGGIYDPSVDAWTATRSDATTPQAREGHLAVWTGSEMIVWGGRVYWAQAPWQWGDTLSGSRYNPTTDTWMPMGGSPPQARSRDTGIWTGSEFIVWGGVHRDMTLFGQPTDTYFNSGGRYNPSTDSWTATRLDGTTPPVRVNHTAVWTGSEMIVWGGESDTSGYSPLGTGGRYSPATNTWASVNYPGPQRRYLHGAVWTGSEMIVWGGTGLGGTLTTGGRYSPSSDSWVPTAVEPDYSGTAIWTGSEMIVWGKSSAVDPFGNSSAGLYSPATDSWRTGSNVSAPEGLQNHSAVWTGTEMIVWGGDNGTSGGRYNPTLDSWNLTNVDDSTPTRRTGPVVSVWTGSEMLIWGGTCSVSGPCPGGRYNPASDSWTPIPANASASGYPGIWTGTEMIVYGGTSYSRYDPNTDQWALGATPDTSYRGYPTAVWTGTEMIVWGGNTPNGYTNAGWRFNPVTNTFNSTSTGPGTPSARSLHSAVWTGDEMIVWGGLGSTYFNSGARYNPATDSWTPTRLDATTPLPREGHLAVWANGEMLIWSSSTDCPTCNIIDTGGRYCACASPITYYQDLDGDGRGNSDTGVSFCGTPAGAWVPTGGDCSDQDSGNWSIPGEVRDLAFSDAVTLNWSAPQEPGSNSLSYDLIRSSNLAGFVGGGVCVANHSSLPSATDANEPAPGSVFYYLARAEDGCPGGTGPLGNDSQGNPRSALSCP